MAIELKHRVPLSAANATDRLPGTGLLPRINSWRPFRRRIKPDELVFFFSQLSLMLEIQMPLKNAMQTMAIQTTNPIFRTAILSIVEDIEQGNQLSDAFRHHPMLFKPLYASMIKAGETGGYLKKILDRIVEMEEKRMALITQIRTALTYPMFLCILSALAVAFIMVGVLPKFVAFFEGKEHILPWTTRFLIAVSDSLREYGWAYVSAGIVLAVLLPYGKNSEQGQALIDRLFVRGPGIARIANKIYTCELLRTLGSLMESRVPLLEALEVTRGTIGNRYFRKFIDQIVTHVQEGGKFSQPLATFPFIMPSVKQMVATGEETGNLPKVLLRLAKFYDTEVERSLKGAAAKIEPMALLVLGGIVGVIVSSVILPIFRLAHALN